MERILAEALQINHSSLVHELTQTPVITRGNTHPTAMACISEDQTLTGSFFLISRRNPSNGDITPIKIMVSLTDVATGVVYITTCIEYHPFPSITDHKVQISCSEDGRYLQFGWRDAGPYRYDLTKSRDTILKDGYETFIPKANPNWTVSQWSNYFSLLLYFLSFDEIEELLS